MSYTSVQINVPTSAVVGATYTVIALVKNIDIVSHSIKVVFQNGVQIFTQGPITVQPGSTWSPFQDFIMTSSTQDILVTSMVQASNGFVNDTTVLQVISPTSVSNASITIYPGVVYQGNAITVTATGFAPTATITYTVNPGGGFVTQTTDSLGYNQVNIGPLTMTPGAYVLTATDKVNGSVVNTVSEGFTVAPPQVTQCLLTLGITGPGTASSNPPAGYISQNTVVTFTATPNVGASFQGWYNGSTLLSTDFLFNYTIITDISINALFTVTNVTLTILPSSVQQGTQSMVSVSGFAHNGQVTFTLLNEDSTQTGTYWIQRLDSNGAGAFGLTFGNNPGTYILQASDGTLTTTRAMTITAGPIVTITPSSVIVGGSTTVSVQNFSHSTALTISITPGTKTISGSTTTDINGNATFSVVVNGNATGPYQLTIYDGANTRVVTITVVAQQATVYSSLAITAVTAQSAAPTEITGVSFSFR
jgi:hypothetical protein